MCMGLIVLLSRGLCFSFHFSTRSRTFLVLICCRLLYVVLECVIIMGGGAGEKLMFGANGRWNDGDSGAVCTLDDEFMLLEL